MTAKEAELRDLKPFHYADETFYPIRRIRRGKWAGYLLCRTWLGLVYFRERP